MLPDLKTYSYNNHDSIILELKKMPVSIQHNREFPKDPDINGKLIFDKDQRKLSGEQTVFSTSIATTI